MQVQIQTPWDVKLSRVPCSVTCADIQKLGYYRAEEMHGFNRLDTFQKRIPPKHAIIAEVTAGAKQTSRDFQIHLLQLYATK